MDLLNSPWPGLILGTISPWHNKSTDAGRCLWVEQSVQWTKINFVHKGSCMSHVSARLILVKDNKGSSGLVPLPHLALVEASWVGQVCTHRWSCPLVISCIVSSFCSEFWHFALTEVWSLTGNRCSGSSSSLIQFLFLIYPFFSLFLLLLLSI